MKFQLLLQAVLVRGPSGARCQSSPEKAGAITEIGSETSLSSPSPDSSLVDLDGVGTGANLQEFVPTGERT